MFSAGQTSFREQNFRGSLTVSKSMAPCLYTNSGRIVHPAGVPGTQRRYALCEAVKLLFLQDGALAEILAALHILHQQVEDHASGDRSGEECQVDVQQTDHGADCHGDDCCPVNALTGAVVIVELLELLIGDVALSEDEVVNDQDCEDRCKERRVELYEYGQASCRSIVCQNPGAGADSEDTDQDNGCLMFHLEYIHESICRRDDVGDLPRYGPLRTGEPP